MARLNVVFICQAVDCNDPLLATTVRWIQVLAGKEAVGTVDVLCLRQGACDLPPNVTVTPIGHTNKLYVIWRFYRTVGRLLITRSITNFFVYQGGVYPILLLPIRIFFRKPIFQWKAHPHINLLMKGCILSDTIIFTSTKSSFPLRSPKVRVAGQGVNVSKFVPQTIPPSVDLVSVGRIEPVKRIEQMIKMVAYYRDHYQVRCRLHLYGTLNDARYKHTLTRMMTELDVEGQVSLLGPITHDRVPGLLNESRVFLHYCTGALDRSVVEAMACGLPVLSTNPCVAEILPPEYGEILIARDGDLEEQTKKLHTLLTMSDEERRRIGSVVRDIVVNHHSDETLFDKIVAEMQSKET